MSLGTLSIDIEARLARLEQGLDQAARINAKTAKQVEDRWGAAGASLKDAMAPLTAALSLASINAFVRQTVDAVDALNDVADVTGATIENISALQDVALRTGTAIDVVETALLKFNQVLNSASHDSEAERVLKSIGLSAKELQQLDPAEALRVTAEALDGYADNGDKARRIQDLFGKSVKEIGPYLKDLATVGKLQATIFTSQAAEAEKLNKAAAELQTNMQSWSRSVVLQVLPAINDLLSAFRDGEGGARGMASGVDAILVPLEALSVFGANVAYVFKGVGTEIGGLAAQLVSLGKGDFAAAAAIHKAMIEDGEKARAEIDAFEKRVLGRRARVQEDEANSRLYGWGNRPGIDARPSVGLVSDPAKDLKQSARSFEDYATTLKLSLSAMIDDTDFVKRQKLIDQLKALDELATANLDPQIVRELRTMLEGASGADAPEDILKRRQADMAAYKGLLESLPTAKTAEVNRLQEQLNAAYEKGTISQLQFKEGSKVLKDQLASLGEGMSEFEKQAQRNIQDAFGQTLQSALKGDFDSILDLWGNLLIQMASQAAAAELNKYLFGGDQGFGSGALVSGLKAVGAMFGGFFADGGTLGAGKWGIAGEAGPEIIRGPAEIVPLRPIGLPGQPRPTAEAPTVIQHINVQSGVGRNELMAAMQMAKQQAVAELYERQRRGGAALGST